MPAPFRTKAVFNVVRLVCIATALLALSCSTGSHAVSSHSHSTRTPAESGAELSVLMVTDIHLDPLADPTIVKTLLDAPVSEWNAIFEKSPVALGPVSSFGADTNYALFRSFLNATAKSDPDFVVITGDFIAHRLDERFAKVTGDTSHADYVRFFNKTEQYIAEQIRANFPNAQILPVIGNNDSACGDYMSQPADPFYSLFSSAWKTESGATHVSASTFSDLLPKTGYYSETLQPKRAQAPLQVIALNDNYWTEKYQNRCGNPSDTPAEDELAWFAKTLQNAKVPVWILSHAPAGMDLARMILKNVDPCARTKPAEMYREPINAKYISLITENRDKVRIMLSGHTHMNEFRVYGATTSAPVGQMISSALSPIYNNNPTYQVLYVNPTSYQVEDVTTYSLDPHTAANGAAAANAWKASWDFTQDYGVSDVSGQSFLSLARSLSDPTQKSAAAFYQHYPSESTVPALVLKNPKAYQCEIMHPNPAEFVSCYCQTQ